MKNTLRYFLAMTFVILQFSYECIGQSNISIDLRLQSTSENQTVQMGAEGQIIFTLENQSSIKATNIKVFVNIPYFPPFVKFASANPLKGSFDVGSGLWSIPELNAQETISLTLKYIPMEYGVWYAEAEIFSSNERDSDSTPNNNIDSEDDFTRSCFSMPIKVSSSTFGRQIILDDSKITNIVWKKDGQTIANQTSNILPVTSVGNYSFSSPTFICPSQGCCPYVFELGQSPLCCEPLEYGLMRATAEQQENFLILQPDSTDGKDANFTSVLPNLNIGKSLDFHVMTWTWNAAGLGAGSRRTLIYFDLSELPANAIIKEATLDLFFNKTSLDYASVVQQYGANTSNQSVLRRVTSPWEESGVTWATQPSVTNENQVFIPSNTGLETDVTVDITNLIKDQHTYPEQSFGFMMSLVTEQIYRSMIFASSDHPDATKHPRLTISYTLGN